MPDPDEFPVPGDAESRSDEGGQGVRCPDCDYSATGDMAAAKLGLHRYRVHGTRGSSKTTHKRQRRAHRKTTTTATAAPSGSRPISQTKILDSVRDSLEESAIKLGALVYPVVPIPSLYLQTTAPDFAETVTRIASRNPKMLARLQSSSDAMDYLALGTWAAGLVIATGVQLGRIPAAFQTQDGPQPNPLVAVFGIDKMYAQAARDFAEEPDARGTTGTDMGDGESPAQAVVAASPV